MKRYLVWCPDRGQTKDDACHVDAVHAMAAALKWAEQDDAAHGDYLSVHGDSAKVIVADVSIPKSQVEFIVSGECVPRYSAREAVEK